MKLRLRLPRCFEWMGEIWSMPSGGLLVVALIADVIGLVIAIAMAVTRH
jgi:hypothetical protein